MMKPSPPKNAQKFLRWFCREDYIEEIEGDITELFEKHYEHSPDKANQKFMWSVIRYFRPGFIKSLKSNHYSSPTGMFRHNFVLTYRNFKRFKTSFFINLMGLSTGLACALFIYLWVSDEVQVDKFHENDSQIFQVLENFDELNGIETHETTSGYMAESLAEEMPEIEYAAAVLNNNENVTVSVDDINLKAQGLHVGKDFFNIFSYPILQGNKEEVWRHRSAMMISEALAVKLFKTTENITGKTVELEHDQQFMITGVFAAPPFSSSQQFDFVLSFEEFGANHQNFLSWQNSPAHAFVKLKPGTDIEAFNEKITDYVKNKRSDRIKHRTPFLKRYSEMYLYGKYENGVQAGGRIEYVRLFSVIGIFILIIACINFMNLSTAKASRRLKEVGVKKAIGADRKALILQYLGESLLMAFISLMVAIMLLVLLLPLFNQITGKQLAVSFDLNLILLVVGITLVTGIIAGSYPALYLSNFNPVMVLKGKLNSSMGELWTRKGLVVFQFAISIILIVSVLVVYQQLEYTQTKNLGYNKDNIILFDREGKAEKEEHLESFLSELSSIPGIVSASSIGHPLTGKDWGVYGLEWEGKDPDDMTQFEHVTVYYDMMETLGMRMTVGRTFSKSFSSEKSKVILNEAAIKHMGLKSPIGKPFTFWGQDMQIIGVAKDFHFESLHENVRPLIIRLWPERTDKFMAKIEAGREKETINKLKKFYQTYNPGFSLDYRFLDQEYQAQYVAEQRVSILSRYFAGLAILISCLGLFGLAAFTAERRLKEIGIRKILGSSEFGIVRLLSSDFTKMVLTAIIIALPISYFIVNSWLNDFAYRINLALWFFIAAGLMALLIAWLTVSFQTIKASRINPLNCLRDE